jgi:hypothetical protein
MRAPRIRRSVSVPEECSLKGTRLALAAMLSALLGSAACQLVLPLHHETAGEGHGIADGGAEADATPLVSYEDEVLIDSPTIYLRLDESQGPTARDVIDGGINGTYPDAGVTYGQLGALLSDSTETAVAFDGTSGITMPPSVPFAGTAPFTVELWANQSSTRSSLGTTLDHDDYSQGKQDRSGWDLLLGSASVSLERFVMGTTVGSAASSSMPLPTDGHYHYVVAMFDGKSLSVYIDLVMVAGTSKATSLPDAGISWMIGQQNCPCAGNGYVGLLDEVAIYSHVLSTERMKIHYQAALAAP